MEIVSDCPGLLFWRPLTFMPCLVLWYILISMKLTQNIISLWSLWSIWGKCHADSFVMVRPLPVKRWNLQWKSEGAFNLLEWLSPALKESELCLSDYRQHALYTVSATIKILLSAGCRDNSGGGYYCPYTPSSTLQTEQWSVLAESPLLPIFFTMEESLAAPTKINSQIDPMRAKLSKEKWKHQPPLPSILYGRQQDKILARSYLVSPSWISRISNSADHRSH